MITVQEAENIISENVKPFPKIKCQITKAYGKILREDILAERGSPPFNRVAMDGIAINFSVWENGLRTFKIQGTQRAGVAEFTLENKSSCIEVMTGAVLPVGTDCVVKVEDLLVSENNATINENVLLKHMQNVHMMDSDHFRGTVLINKGEKLISTRIAVAASEGKSEILVSKEPGVAIISTGDELVDVEGEVKHYQIRRSNSYAIQSALKQSGFAKAEVFHINDDKRELTEKLQNMMNEFDILILSGGVSMGKFDYLPTVFEELEIEKKFHKIRQKPGKPFWFGVSSSGKPVFSLPGNPVSAMVCFHRYILPELFRAMKINNDEKEFAVLDEELNLKNSLTNFVPVKICNENGILKAKTVKTNGSGDYASLVYSDGFLELFSEGNTFKAGYVAPFYRWKV